ncbi:39S ribosomal protein L2 mitochondrial [Schistosoma japonicum]|nr:39S ribosomal protein L2 mitochondrial [Schistosoma japonicum]
MMHPVSGLSLNKYLRDKLINQWIEMVHREDFTSLGTGLLRHYYDPLYANSCRQFTGNAEKYGLLHRISLDNVDITTIRTKIIPQIFYKFDPKEGDAYSVGALPVGTVISKFEIKPGQGALFCRTAGSSATVFRRGKYVGSKLSKESNSKSSNVELEDEYVFVRTNGKRKICRLMPTCISVVGQVSNQRDDQFKFRKFSEKKCRGIKRCNGL